MKTESHSINSVLSKNATSFFIPPFQRAYAWGTPEIERYFSDILRIIKSELDETQNDKQEHFFGTIVIKEERAGFSNISIVVDGQQRLTTTLIFLIALRDSIEDIESKNFITNNYLKNPSSSYEEKIKLKQVTSDWDSYRALINGTEAQPGLIKEAYNLFKKLINDKKRLNPQILFDHYIIAIQRINVAVIFLDERPFKGEDPQIIFETLNSLGKPLTLSDLVRNFVLFNMNSEKQSEIFENIWHPKIEKILKENTSKFFRDYLQYKTASSLKVVSHNNTKELYQKFKEFVNKEFTEHNDFIKDIIKYVKCYNWIVTEVNTDIISHNPASDEKIKELLRNIFHDIKTEAFKPFVLGLLEYHQYEINKIKLSDDKLIASLKTIRTYLIRRRISGLSSGENQNIVLLSKKIELIVRGNIRMIDILTNLFYAIRLPNDNEIRNTLRQINFYEALKRYSKFILGKIEENNTKVTVPFRNRKITIEHIMPQTLNDSWITDLGENYVETHKKYLHNIGNLILTEFNSEIGNKSFEEKKRKLKTSSLFYRLSVVNKNKWDESSIIEHQSNMIEWFIKTFPLPKEFRESSNWNTRIIKDTSFSPLDSNSGKMAEGNKPTELHIGEIVFRVKTWQDVLIKFIKYIKNNPKYDFSFIINNQTELLIRKDAILRWSELKPVITDNPIIETRYKTLNGKSWDKEKKLNDTSLFVHTNMSASNCMTRIGNIMSAFHIPAEDVTIILK